jgi:hypothetical protein
MEEVLMLSETCQFFSNDCKLLSETATYDSHLMAFWKRLNCGESQGL